MKGPECTGRPWWPWPASPVASTHTLCSWAQELIELCRGHSVSAWALL